MNYYKKLVLFIVDSWRLVMNVKYNPLKYIPDPSLQTYFMLVLFTVWSVYFGFVATYYLGWLGYSVITSIIVHLGVFIPLFFTNAVFLDAERDGAQWLKKIRREQEGDK